MGQVLLEIKGLRKYFPIYAGTLRKHVGDVKAVDGVDLRINKGDVFGLVGESGCGKTTAGRASIRALEPTAGQVLFYEDDRPIDITKLSVAQLRRQRRKMQMIFQDPYSSLNPRMTVQELVSEPLHRFGVGNEQSRNQRVIGLLEAVGLDPRFISRFPHAFSGGQRQRIGIARALALNPEFVVADEPVSALDVSVQAQILNLLQDLRKEYHLTYLFITHDLGVVDYLCNRVAVMYVGRIVEVAPTKELFRSPQHPYTKSLISAVPRPDPTYRPLAMQLKGEIANPANPPPGCAFHPRCPYTVERCRTERPILRQINDQGDPAHLVACHLAEQLSKESMATAMSG